MFTAGTSLLILLINWYTKYSNEKERETYDRRSDDIWILALHSLCIRSRVVRGDELIKVFPPMP
jgi:hypothetical protein